jgi:AraC-like DNA-binding protein
MNTRSSQRPELLVHRKYSDMNALANDTGWELDFRQLDKGVLEAEALLVGHQDLALTRFRFNRRFHQLGKLPPLDWTFGLPDSDAGPLMWKGEKTQAGVLVNFSFDDHLDVTNTTAPFTGFVLSVNQSILDQARAELGLPGDFFSNVKRTRFWSRALRTVSDLRRMVGLLCTVAEEEGTPGLAIWEHVFNEGLPAQLLRATSGEGLETENVTSSYRLAALSRALEVINGYDDMPETVNTLCEMTGCSWSTLERAFKDEFGVGPKAYLKIRRLTAVRNEISRIGPGATIHEIANRWGFWHMGSFAADYQKQFGELPSESRKRIRRP